MLVTLVNMSYYKIQLEEKNSRIFKGSNWSFQGTSNTSSKDLLDKVFKMTRDVPIKNLMTKSIDLY